MFRFLHNASFAQLWLPLAVIAVGGTTAEFTPVASIPPIRGWNACGFAAYCVFLIVPTALHVKEAIQWHISRSRI